MANLKRNTITLVEEVLEGEIKTKTHITPVFIPLDVVYEALDLMEKFEDDNEKTKVSEREMFEILVNFVTEKVYDNKFTIEQLKKGLHAPQAIEELRSQLMFVVQGQQSDETKKFLEKKR